MKIADALSFSEESSRWLSRRCHGRVNLRESHWHERFHLTLLPRIRTRAPVWSTGIYHFVSFFFLLSSILFWFLAWLLFSPAHLSSFANGRHTTSPPVPARPLPPRRRPPFPPPAFLYFLSFALRFSSRALLGPFISRYMKPARQSQWLREAGGLSTEWAILGSARPSFPPTQRRNYVGALASAGPRGRD